MFLYILMIFFFFIYSFLAAQNLHVRANFLTNFSILTRMFYHYYNIYLFLFVYSDRASGIAHGPDNHFAYFSHTDSSDKTESGRDFL